MLNKKVERTPENVEKFLIENEVYLRFMKNLRNYYNKGTTIESYLAMVGKVRVISGAFIWDRTSEGAEFWDDIQKKVSDYFIDEPE